MKYGQQTSVLISILIHQIAQAPNLDEHEQYDLKNGIVLFAGAGCSMAPPSSLPGWVDLNDAIIETLWDRLEPYGLRNAFREKIIPAIKERRRESKFPPDYQAQRMVERVGLCCY